MTVRSPCPAGAIRPDPCLAASYAVNSPVPELVIAQLSLPRWLLARCSAVLARCACLTSKRAPIVHLVPLAGDYENRLPPEAIRRRFHGQ